jgi:anti-anti-sigma regulatory factor
MNINLVIIPNILSFIGVTIALVTIPRIPHSLIGKTSRYFLGIAAVLYLTVTTSNILEHLGITATLDRLVENAAKALYFPFILFFFYANWLWQETLRRQNAESHLDELNKFLKSSQQLNLLLSEQTRVVEEDFYRAAEIMQTLLPVYAPTISGVSICAIHRPSHQVGGDLYDIIQLDNNHVAVFVADATGHGVASALLAMLFKSHLYPGGNGKTNFFFPEKVIEGINKRITEKCLGTGMFVTAAYGVLDTQSRLLTLVSAGHPPVLLHHYNGDNNVSLYPATGPALGLSAHAHFTQVTLQMQPGDRILMYTDGLFCQNDKPESHQVNQIAGLLSDRKLHGINLINRISESLHCENELTDDVTMLLLELTAGLSRMENSHPSAQAPSQVKEENDRCKISVGGSLMGIFVKLYGRAEWTCAVGFNEVCKNALAEAQVNEMPLFIDMKNCSHLDSTFLGTVYELFKMANSVKTEIYLQNLSPGLRALFVELGMNIVTDHIRDTAYPLPAKMTFQDITSDTKLNPERILQAHEAIATVNQRNQQQFGQLVESLRREIRSQKK